MRAIVCTSVAIEEALRLRLAPMDIEVVDSIARVEAAAAQPGTLVLLDGFALESLPPDTVLPCPVVACCDGPLQMAIGWLGTHLWLSHVVSLAMLLQPQMATVHMRNVLASFDDEGKPRLLDRVRESLNGRRVGIIQASKRIERLEKMTEYFEGMGIGSRTIQMLRDAAEELLTNAFYDAPVAAGAVSKPISRTLDVALPDETPCDMMYGCSEDVAVVRVRDPFGALSRTRIVEVLTRCSRTDGGVEVDESMGGAGLGLWRIFSVASFVAISVVQGHHTDILVGIGKRSVGGQRPYAFHLFFRESGKRRQWRLDKEGPVEHSFATAVENS